MRRLPWLAAVASLALGGCIFQHFTPIQKLTDQAYALNDEARWARIDLATQRVAPEYRATFLATHREWGGEIQIADADMTNVVLGDEEQGATSVVTVSWYDRATMQVRSTTLRQHWVQRGGGFLLDEEQVVGGDEGLLHRPQADTEEAREPVESRESEGPLAAR
jgi:hypothetical protein